MRLRARTGFEGEATRRETQFQPALYGPSQATAKLGRWTSYIVNYIPV